MTNERDPELAELLDSDPTPEHGPDFWGDLDAALAAEPAPVDDAADNPSPAAAPVEIELEDDDAAQVVSIESHPRFRRWGVAVVGIAAVAIAALIGVNLTQEDSVSPPVQSDPTVPEGPPPSVTGSTDIDYSTVVETIDLGAGRALAWSPNGAGVLVVDDDAGGTVTVRQLDGSEAVPAFEGDERTVAQLEITADGRVAWTEWCEATPCRLYTGQMQDDGRIAAITQVTVPGQLDNAPNVRDLAWGDDGTLYAVIVNSLYSVNAVDQAAESLGIGAQLVEPYPEGPFASASSIRVTVGRQLDPLLDLGDINGLAVAADGGLIAVISGESGDVTIYDAETGREQSWARMGTQGGVVWAPNNRTIFYWGQVGAGLLTVGNQEGSAGGSSEWDGTIAGAFSPDGGALAYTTDEESPRTSVAVFASEGASTTAPSPPSPSADAPTPVGLIDGTVMGLLDDDNALVLRDDFESTGSFCGGDGPAQSLWQVPLDGSEPTLLTQDLEGPARYFRSFGDRMANISGCQVFDTLAVEDLADDNNELLTVNVADIASTGGDVRGLSEIDWVDDNVLLVTGFLETLEGRAWRVEIDTGLIEELTDLNGDPYADVVDVALGLQGELMVLGADYFASVDEPTTLDGVGVGMLSMNGPVAYNRGRDLWRLGLDEPYGDFEAIHVYPSADGAHVLATGREPRGLRLLETELEGTFRQEVRSWPVIDADGGDGFWTADSSRFVYSARVENARGGDADGYEVRLLEFGAPDDTTPPPTTAVAPTESIATPTCTPQQPPALGSDDDTVPQPVFETQQAVAIAAATCDYNTLAALAGPDLFMGFGLPDDIDPLTEWAENEATGRSLAEVYLDVLLYEGGVRTRADGSELWQWPAVATYDAIEDIPTDVLARYLERSGLTEEELADTWETFDGFPTYVLSIETDGTWVGAAPAD